RTSSVCASRSKQTRTRAASAGNPFMIALILPRAPLTLGDLAPERFHIALDARVESLHELLADRFLLQEPLVAGIAYEPHLGEDRRHVRPAPDEQRGRAYAAVTT